MIGAIGRERWERSGRAEEFGDIDPPRFFTVLFALFIDLYHFCPGGMSYRDIAAYRDVMGVEIPVYEAGLLRRMASWAAAETNAAFRGE